MRHSDRIKLEPAQTIPLERFLTDNDLYLTLKQNGYGLWKATCTGLLASIDGSWVPLNGASNTPDDAAADFADKLCGRLLRIGKSIYESKQLDFTLTIVEYVP